tara:strand:+ start:8581 stop:8985 length:405 start_codon:yes stop_codon:yes gene_type:complete
MPFDPININPDDLNPNIAIGVNLPLNGPGVFTSTFTTKEAKKNNLINFFLTNPGEIPLNPQFGAGLKIYLFEQSNEPTFEDLKSFIKGKLDYYFPSIEILNLDVLSPDGRPNDITISLNYSIDDNITDNITLQF